ncbi:MAG: glycine cleavage system protein H, partial [Candidatus Bathyarchaeia archaeon]
MAKLFDKYEFPEGLYYSKDHMWAKIEDGKVRVGLTDFGQKMAGKILMVRPRPIGTVVEQGKMLGTMET